MKNEFFLNAFTRVTLEGIRLGEMQVANPRFSYSLVDADKARAEIDMHVRPMREFDMIRSLYHAQPGGCVPSMIRISSFSIRRSA